MNRHVPISEPWQCHEAGIGTVVFFSSLHLGSDDNHETPSVSPSDGFRKLWAKALPYLKGHAELTVRVIFVAMATHFAVSILKLALWLVFWWSLNLEMWDSIGLKCRWIFYRSLPWSIHKYHTMRMLATVYICKHACLQYMHPVWTICVKVVISYWGTCVIVVEYLVGAKHIFGWCHLLLCR